LYHIRRHANRVRVLTLSAAAITFLATSWIGLAPAAGADPATVAAARQTIKHVIIIMQENRSFDHYFGTYPGADGLPQSGGVFTVCMPDPQTKTCVFPYHDRSLTNGGGGHNNSDALIDIDGGKMDGFIADVEKLFPGHCGDPSIKGCTIDVMGYHDNREIPNYWTYAQNFVLHDHMFEPVAAYTMTSHLFLVSEWAAKCTTHNVPSSCKNWINPYAFQSNQQINVPFAWTDLTYLLHRQNPPVSWGYYVVEGTEPDCLNPKTLSCTPTMQTAASWSFFNPLPAFDTVAADGELGNIQSVANFYAAAYAGTLPAVSWVVPSGPVSEHPSYSIRDGQAYVTSLINAVMSGSDWASSAIFLAWDDWSGFYDHVVPPAVDINGYGLRVPSLVISPYAKQNVIDHAVLSFDAYAKFIEDLFLGGQRLDPKTDKRSDPRPSVRETLVPGDLMNDFDFKQTARGTLLLPEYP